MRWRTIGLLGPAVLMFPLLLQAQLGRGGPGEVTTSTLVIRVRAADGGPLSGPAIVRLVAIAGSLNVTTSTREAGDATIGNVVPGNYNLEVTAPGYKDQREEVRFGLADISLMYIVFLQPESPKGSDSTPPSGSALVLAPKAQAEMEKGVAALQANRLQDARKSFEKALKMAPGHPDLHYLLGLVFLQMNDVDAARKSLEKAVAIYPSHVRALAALGELCHRQGDFAGAVKYLEHAITLDPSSWRVQGLLAQAYYALREFPKARTHAERAVDLSKRRAPDVRLLLARTLAALGESEESRKLLEAISRDFSSQPEGATARTMLGNGHGSSPEPPPAKESKIAAELIAEVPTLPLVRHTPVKEAPRSSWAPPDVDEIKMDVAPDMPCSLPGVLRGASLRARVLVNSLERINATERIEHTEFGSDGKPGRTEEREFDYVVTIRQHRRGVLSVEEDRLGAAFYSFASGLAAKGLPALALIFHPTLVGDYDMRCEGLGSWNGKPAWLVSFRQNPEKPNRFRTYNTSKGSFAVKLKGRVWLAANTYDVLRMETEMMEPIPQIELLLDRLIIEYTQVKFSKSDQQLWLPSTAVMYTHFRGKRYRFRHSFRDFMLFSVDTRHEIENKPEPPPPTPPQP